MCINGKLFLVFALIPMVFLAGCTHKSQQYVPSVSLDISDNSISIKDSQTSGIVTITLTKTDDMKISTEFKIKLSSFGGVFPIAVTGSSQTISEATTRTLIDKGSSDTLQFKVFGQLPQGNYSEVKGTITAQAYFNTTTPVSNLVTLNVKITK